MSNISEAPSAHEIADQSDDALVLSFAAPQIGWRSYLLAGLGLLALVAAIAAPLWAYKHVKLSFPPMVGDDVGVTTVGQPVNIPILANDADPISFIDRKSIELKTLPLHGTVSPNLETGVVTYSPEPGYVGRDLFTYSVKNVDGVPSNLAVVKLTVNR